LNENLKRSEVTPKEGEQIKKLIQQHGNKFRKIASIMGRTENSVKNYYSKELKDQLKNKDKQGDPNSTLSSSCIDDFLELFVSGNPRSNINSCCKIEIKL
jgi:hypothetical protein